MQKIILSFLLFVVTGLPLFAQTLDQQKLWQEAEQQMTLLLNEAREGRDGQKIFPRTLRNDSLNLVASNDWTSGFLPGLLWMMYEKTGKPQWKAAAVELTALMIKEPNNNKSHDIGFKVYNSFGQGYRILKDSSYKRLIIEGAKTLASRFNPTVGCIRSWDFGRWQYPVIIDNMMNLELLFAATKLSGDSTFYHIAVTHALTTIKNHFRSDHSSYHVVDYDTTTGKVRSKGTHQGYGHESSWARGQAWALYGYTMCYRETKNEAFLNKAKSVASFLLNHPALPKDGVPYWDFDVPNLQNEPRDVSAAAIIASALFELGDHAKDKSFRQASDKIVESLASHYRAKIGEAKGFLLLHSTGHKPAQSEVDVPLIYADYYFVEALKRREAKQRF